MITSDIIPGAGPFYFEGSNVGIGTSPYAYLNYGEGMYMGRRIASEIQLAIKNDELRKVVY